MPIKITSKKDLIDFLTKLTVTERFTNMGELGLEFKEDDFLQCSECEVVETPTLFFMVEPMTAKGNGKFVCAGCKEDLLRPIRHCSGCEKKIKHLDNPVQVRYTLNGEEHEGEVCRECNEIRRYHKSYIVCPACQRFEAGERMADAEGHVVCQHCIQRNYYYCPHCEDHHRNRNRDEGRITVPRVNVTQVNRVPLDALIDAEHAGIAAVV